MNCDNSHLYGVHKNLISAMQTKCLVLKRLMAL